jgi:hypothetical protein
MAEEFHVVLELSVTESVNLDLLARSLYRMLKRGKAQFPSDLLWRTNGSEQSQKRFAADLILLGNLLRRAVEEDGPDLSGESARDLDRMTASFSMEEASALCWVVVTMIRLLADDHPELPSVALDEDVHDRILSLIRSANAKNPIHRSRPLISLTPEGGTALLHCR